MTSARLSLVASRSTAPQWPALVLYLPAPGMTVIEVEAPADAVLGAGGIEEPVEDALLAAAGSGTPVLLVDAR